MSMPAVILLRPRFPENIGMAARAMANMGATQLVVIAPELWLREKAAPLATPKGLPILDHMQIFADLESALAPFQLVCGTTARTGGWRREVGRPEKSAQMLCEGLADGLACALLFGPEDRGLNNAEISVCNFLCHIPTAEASSLNLAQAVLLMLYECFKAAHPVKREKQKEIISHAQQAMLEENLKNVLLMLDCLHGQNPDYFFCQWQQILRRARLAPHEFACLMGFCRQLGNMGKGHKQR